MWAEYGSGEQKQNGNGTAKNGRGGLFRDEVLGQVKALCEAVGFSLSAGVLKTVGNADDPAKIRDMAKLTAVFEKLQDLARGVERLRAAIGKVGERRYSELCRNMNLASDSIDDIPDRATLRKLLQTLEPEAGLNQPTTVPDNGGGPANRLPNDHDGLGELRGRLLREAARVSGALNRTLGDVIQEAAKGCIHSGDFGNTAGSRRGQGDGCAARIGADGGCAVNIIREDIASRFDMASTLMWIARSWGVIGSNRAD